MTSNLIKKVAQKISVEYCRLSIVENPDGFLTQEMVRNLLDQESCITTVCGSNLQLRIHFEVIYKSEVDRKFVYICNSLETILADMRHEAFVSRFSISDMFPLFADKPLLRKQPFEVLDILYGTYGMRKVSMLDGASLVGSIAKEIEDKKRLSAKFFNEQLQDINVDWSHPAQTISSVSLILSNAMRVGVYDEIASTVATINDSFQQWIDSEYFAALHSNPIKTAKSVNNILPHILENYDHDDKVALLVIDGFAYWQYSVLREILKRVEFSIEDGCTLAWMPSITMLSRQAIFRGEDPIQDYKQNPENEKKLWFDYWQNHGFESYEVQYIYDTDGFAINPGIKRLAVVTVEMDEKMHSSTDYKDLLSLTENWCLRNLEKIKSIVDAGYTLYLTTDHGSVLSHGWRSLTTAEKVFLYKDGSRGMRHLIYNNEDEQNRFYAENIDLQLIKHDNWMAIRNDSCLAKEDKITITHGGSHFMEMVIPLIKIKK